MILELIFFVLAVICYTVSQAVIHGKFKYSGDRLGFWGEDSYLRKYKNIHKEKGKFQVDAPYNNWYYSVFVIKYKERFPGSATIFTFLTDGYHFCQWAFKIFLCLSFAPQIGLIWAGILWLTWGIVFSVVYKFVQR